MIPSRSKCEGLPCYQCREACTSEFVGTLALVLAGAGTVAATSLVELPQRLFLIALAFGLTVGLLGISLGRISGAHVNPAVSLASLLAGRLRTGLIVPYAFFQVLGAITGGEILRIVFPASSASSFLGSTLLSPSVTPEVAVLFELAGTFLLSSTILIVSLRKFCSRKQAALVGITLFLLILVLGPLTGASFNPARSLGSALGSGHFENLGVFLVGPLAGGAAAGALGRLRRV